MVSSFFIKGKGRYLTGVLVYRRESAVSNKASKFRYNFVLASFYMLYFSAPSTPLLVIIMLMLMDDNAEWMINEYWCCLLISVSMHFFLLIRFALFFIFCITVWMYCEQDDEWMDMLQLISVPIVPFNLFCIVLHFDIFDLRMMYDVVTVWTRLWNFWFG